MMLIAMPDSEVNIVHVRYERRSQVGEQLIAQNTIQMAKVDICQGFRY